MIAERCTTHMVRPALLTCDFCTSNLSSETHRPLPGFEGTRMKWPPELRSKPRDEVFQNAPNCSLEFSYSERQLVKILNRSKWEHEVARVEDSVRSKGRLTIGVNASSL